MYRDTDTFNVIFNIFGINFEHFFSKLSALFNHTSFTFVLLSDFFLHKYGLLKRIAVLLLGLILAVGVNATMHEEGGGNSRELGNKGKHTPTKRL